MPSPGPTIEIVDSNPQPLANSRVLLVPEKGVRRANDSPLKLNPLTKDLYLCYVISPQLS
jgi:hypothetical protein